MAVEVRIEVATVRDAPLLLSLIRALAAYERMSDDVVATETRLRDTLFGLTPCAEAVIARVEREAVGFALWFQSYSTFLAQPGLYLEDLFVLPDWRGRGVGANETGEHDVTTNPKAFAVLVRNYTVADAMMAVVGVAILAQGPPTAPPPAFR